MRAPFWSHIITRFDLIESNRRVSIICLYAHLFRKLFHTFRDALLRCLRDLVTGLNRDLRSAPIASFALEAAFEIPLAKSLSAIRLTKKNIK